MTDSLTKFIIKLFLNHTESLLESYIYHAAKNTFLKNKDKKEEKRFRDRIHYILNKLTKQNLIQKQKLQNNQNIFICKDKTKLLDLMMSPAHPKPPVEATNTQIEQAESQKQNYNPKHLIFPQYRRTSEEWRDSAKRLLTKPLQYVSNEDKERLELNFLTWTDRYKDRFLLLKTPDETFEIKEASTRFTDEIRAKTILSKFNDAFNNARKTATEGIFLTITLPQCFSIRIQQLILSFLMHRIKALLRKQHKETIQHIRVNEPQQSLGFHIHVIFINISYFMPKDILTSWLDKHVDNFLSEMGNHIKQVINKKLDSEEIERLNRYGKRILKRYQNWKEKQIEKARKKGKKKHYTGPVNFITAIDLTEEDGKFEELPPDAEKYLDKREHDGKEITVKSYLKKYLLKNLYTALKLQKDEFTKDTLKIAFYWLTRSQFFTCSPKLRTKTPKPPPQGWRFIGSFDSSQLEDILESQGITLATP